MKGYIMRKLKQYLERDYVRRKASAVYQSRVDATVEACVRRYPSIALLSLCIKLFRTPWLRKRGYARGAGAHYHHHPSVIEASTLLLPRVRLLPSLQSPLRGASGMYRKIYIGRGEGSSGARADVSPGRRRLPTAEEREWRRKALQ